jgi:hypothetical protein
VVSGMGKSGLVDKRLRPRWQARVHPPFFCTQPTVSMETLVWWAGPTC